MIISWRESIDLGESPSPVPLRPACTDLKSPGIELESSH
jgi:hypothetical protein